MAIPVIHDTTPTGPTRTVIRRTCPAGHAYISGTDPDPVLLLAWVTAHETHEETK